MLKIACILLLLTYGVWFYRHKQQLGSVTALKKREDGSYLIQSNGSWIPAELLGTSIVTTFVSILYFKLGRSREQPYCILFKDSLPEDQYRRLMVLLRTGS